VLEVEEILSQGVIVSLTAFESVPKLHESLLKLLLFHVELLFADEAVLVICADGVLIDLFLCGEVLSQLLGLDGQAVDLLVGQDDGLDDPAAVPAQRVLRQCVFSRLDLGQVLAVGVMQLLL
jgi:hypothetical protein